MNRARLVAMARSLRPVWSKPVRIVPPAGTSRALFSVVPDRPAPSAAIRFVPIASPKLGLPGRGRESEEDSLVRGQLLAFLPCGSEGVLAQRLLCRRHRGVDIGPTVRGQWCTHPPPPSQCRCGQHERTSGRAPRPPLPWPPLREQSPPSSTGRPANAAANPPATAGGQRQCGRGPPLSARRTAGPRRSRRVPHACRTAPAPRPRARAPGRSRPAWPQPGRGC